jgi:hypothetical protein
MLGWAATALALTAFASALWHVARRTAPVLVGTAAVAIGEWSFPTGGVRYLFPLGVVAWFAVTRRRPGLERRLAVAAVALSPWLALDLGIYTLAGSVGAAILDELAVRRIDSSDARSRWAIELIAVAIGWAACLGFLAATGRLGPTLAFVLDQQSTSAYVAQVSPVGTFLGQLRWSWQRRFRSYSSRWLCTRPHGSAAGRPMMLGSPFSLG